MSRSTPRSRICAVSSFVRSLRALGIEEYVREIRRVAELEDDGKGRYKRASRSVFGVEEGTRRCRCEWRGISRP
jgi:hypothetical protein